MDRIGATENSSELDLYKSNTPTEIGDSYHEGYYGVQEQQGNEKALLNFVFSTLRRHWMLIVGVTVFATALSVVYVAQKPDYFTAAARVQVNAENSVLPSGQEQWRPHHN